MFFEQEINSRDFVSNMCDSLTSSTCCREEPNSGCDIDSNAMAQCEMLRSAAFAHCHHLVSPEVCLVI